MRVNIWKHDLIAIYALQSCSFPNFPLHLIAEFQITSLCAIGSYDESLFMTYRSHSRWIWGCCKLIDCPPPLSPLERIQLGPFPGEETPSQLLRGSFQESLINHGINGGRAAIKQALMHREMGKYEIEIYCPGERKASLSSAA